MSRPPLFITGTDTEIGKTVITCSLIHALQNTGHSVAAAKPLASGAYETANGLRNEDAVALQQAQQSNLSYQDINPILFPQAIAPHIAADIEQQPLSVELLTSAMQPFLGAEADYHIIEGVGGWLVPLNQQQMMSDFVSALRCQVILVVGVRLGCLNHALLTYEGIKQSGLDVIAWVANCCDPQAEYIEENIQTLQQQFPAPLLGVVPYQATVDSVSMAQYLDITLL